MNIIQTSAPINIEDLKKYFLDKSIVFNIDYTTSSIKGSKLLTYISNLDIPCDIKFNDDTEINELLSSYLDSSFIVSLPILEKKIISLLFQNKGLIEVTDLDLLTTLKPSLDNWTEKLDSLPLFNLYSIQSDELKQWVVNNHIEDDTTDLQGINFVSLLKHEEFYFFYQTMTDNPKYYSKLFSEYMFKGKNLYSFWATENNPMHLLTQAIAEDTDEVRKYTASVKNADKEII
jgi:hypothetical protein